MFPKRVARVILCTALFFQISGVTPLLSMPQKPDQAKMKQIIAEFEKYAQKTIKEWQIPGMAVAIVADDKIVYARGFGVKEINGNEPVDTRTLFQIGSTTKAFTAALAAMMVDEGRMAWKDRVISPSSGKLIAGERTDVMPPSTSWVPT